MKRYAITFGEVAILHVGSKELGKRRNSGFTIDELLQLNDNISDSEFISLSDKLPQKLRKENEAGVLIIRNATDLFLGKNSADILLKEQDNIQYDKKYFDNRRKKTLNKRARYNIVFGEHEVLHSDDYKTFSIKSFHNVPYLNQIRNKLSIIRLFKKEITLITPPTD